MNPRLSTWRLIVKETVPDTLSALQRRPADTRQPLHAPGAEGYWFDQGGRNYVICWTPTGSVEKFTLDAAGTSASGRWNDAENLAAVKL
jgi:hypothetical protein